jgi:phenylalanyl-tRNA synthetase beta chain
MKISIEWIRDYVDLQESPEKLKEDLSMVGLLVETMSEVHNSPVLEVEVTSNRPDCLSYIGMARQISAMYQRPLKTPPVQTNLEASSDTIPFAIEIRDEELCPRYAGLVMDGVKIEPSPIWMQQRLEAAGMRPLNNIVDISNYVLLEMGHPLHTFDFDVLRKGKIVVDRAKQGQVFQTLDGTERQLDNGMLMINDGEGPVAIAGVMGGLNSEISLSTRRVLIESAYFRPPSVRRTSRKLGLSTEASYRFERGADWNYVIPAIARTCHLIERLAGGRIVGSLQDVYPKKQEPVRILLHRAHVASLLGVEMIEEFVDSTLYRLGFKLEAKGQGVWEVSCPSFRADMELEADLIEELACFYGYQNIPSVLPPSQTAGMHSPVYALENAIRKLMVGQGYSEALNLSFASEADHVDFPTRESGRIAVKNPLTEDTQYMRTTMAPGLVRSAKRNFSFDQKMIRLFEIGKVYGPGPDGIPNERSAVGILGTGGFAGLNWANPSPEYGFFHLKGLIDVLMQGLRIRAYTIKPTTDVAWLNPRDAAKLEIGDDCVGMFGSLSPVLEDKYKLRQPAFLAELDFDRLAKYAFSPVMYASLPKFPSVERDMSIVVSRETTYYAIYGGIMGLGIPELSKIDLIDVYEGEKIPKGSISLTLRFTFQDSERTLTVDRVQGFIDTILSLLTKSYGAGLRSL